MKYLIIYLSELLLLLSWIAGVVLANGFWSTVFSIFIPPWAWYLVVELLMNKYIL